MPVPNARLRVFRIDSPVRPREGGDPARTCHTERSSWIPAFAEMSGVCGCATEMLSLSGTPHASCGFCRQRNLKRGRAQMNRFSFFLAAAAVAVGLPTAAMADRPGFTVTDLNLRAGPGYQFPVVDRLPAGAHVRIEGCLPGYRWCDVVWRGEYGWVRGRELAFLYNGRRVVVFDYG